MLNFFGKWIFDSNINFLLILSREDQDYCCTNDNQTELFNGYEGVLKSTGFFPTEKKCFVQK